MCDEQISTLVSTTPKAHAPTRTSDLEGHLGRLHPEILKMVQKKDNAWCGTPTASYTKTLSAEKKPTTATLTSFFASDKVTITVTPDGFKKSLLTLLFSLAFF